MNENVLYPAVVSEKEILNYLLKNTKWANKNRLDYSLIIPLMVFNVTPDLKIILFSLLLACLLVGPLRKENRQLPYSSWRKIENKKKKTWMKRASAPLEKRSQKKTFRLAAWPLRKKSGDKLWTETDVFSQCRLELLYSKNYPKRRQKYFCNKKLKGDTFTYQTIKVSHLSCLKKIPSFDSRKSRNFYDFKIRL